VSPPVVLFLVAPLRFEQQLAWRVDFVQEIRFVSGHVVLHGTNRVGPRPEVYSICANCQANADEAPMNPNVSARGVFPIADSTQQHCP
jgi:hypothetical protein